MLVKKKLKQGAIISEFKSKEPKKNKQEVNYIKTKEKQFKCFLKNEKTPFFNWVERLSGIIGTVKKGFLKTLVKGVLKKKKEKPQLKIIFKSYGASSKEATDIKQSIGIVTRLIRYLNHFCIKHFKNAGYFKKQKHYDYLDISSITNAYFKLYGKERQVVLAGNNSPLPLFLLFTSAVKTKAEFFQLELETLKTKLKTKREQKQQKQQTIQKLSSVLTLQKNNYSSRYFFKWCQFFANSDFINKQVQKPPQSVKLFTVVRSPFVFKKTREQFSSRQLSYYIIVKLQNPMQKRFLIQCLGLLRLPSELEILDY